MTSKIEKITDPAYVGPGTWWYTHMKGKEAITDKKIDEFISHMYLLAEKFPCPKCRGHIREYIDTHPFNDLKNLKNRDGQKIGMFKWSWMFHNSVNSRLGKPHVDWETAWKMYDEESEVCGQGCSEVDRDINDNNNINNYDLSERDNIKTIPNDIDRKSRMAQSYFMSIGIPKTLKTHTNYMNNNDMNNNGRNVTFISH
jgi:hypothetical protein